MSILDEIMAHKRDEVARLRAVEPLARVRAASEAAPPALDFTAALRSAAARPALIAEIKRRSPSRGALAPDLDPLRLARIYRENGAACISVLTDEKYFGGSLDDLRRVRGQPHVGAIPGGRPTPGPGQPQGLPLLRKDFVCDPYQVYEARAAGADAVLLIVAALAPGLLRDLHALVRGLGMAALIEVHSDAELETAMTCDPALVGINNRDLHSFSVDLATTERLAQRIPGEVCVVAESGIHGPDDLARLRAIPRPGGAMGVDAILVGEALVTAADVGAKVREMVGAPSPRASFARLPLPARERGVRPPSPLRGEGWGEGR
jgi:indole-3-glycerol phosphate synthase